MISEFWGVTCSIIVWCTLVYCEWHNWFRKPPPQTESITTWERVEYKEEEIELETTINFEL